MTRPRMSVHKSEAPPAGWYPDPRRREQLRWWDGTDWSPHVRPPPHESEVAAVAAAAAAEAASAASESAAAGSRRRRPGVPAVDAGSFQRQDVDQIVSQVRQAARAEVDRAADVFSQRARAATRDIEPLISQYTNSFFRLLKWALAVAVFLIVAWFVFEAVASATFFEWLGDRIDNLTDDNSS